MGWVPPESDEPPPGYAWGWLGTGPDGYLTSIITPEMIRKMRERGGGREWDGPWATTEYRS